MTKQLLQFGKPEKGLSKNMLLCWYLSIQDPATRKLEGNSILGSAPAETEVKGGASLAGMWEIQEGQCGWGTSGGGERVTRGIVFQETSLNFILNALQSFEEFQPGK